jgi:hypothetical protein
MASVQRTSTAGQRGQAQPASVVQEEWRSLMDPAAQRLRSSRLMLISTLIDEFAFDRIERTASPQAANLLYKIIDARSRKRSTALVTNIDFDAWGDYLGDPPLAMAFLDRITDGAIILKINGKSFRAHRGRQPKSNPPGKLQTLNRGLPAYPFLTSRASCKCDSPGNPPVMHFRPRKW